MYTLYQILQMMQVGSVVRAEYADYRFWYITMTVASEIRYCNEDGENVGDLVPLTRSNMNAYYDFIRE